jgi:hypothetical protein
MHNALIAADRAATQMDEFVTGMEHRGNRDVNGQESCEFARPAWASSLSKASTRHSGSGTGRGLPSLGWPFTEYLWRGADVNDSLTAGPLRGEIPCGGPGSASQLWRSTIGPIRKENRTGGFAMPLTTRPVPSYTPIGYSPVIVGQKRRIAPPLTHAHAEPQFQALFRTRTGEMSAPPLASARTTPAFDPQSLTRDPRSSIPVTAPGRAARRQPGMSGCGQGGALNLTALPTDLPAAPGLRLARFATVTTISRR